MSYLGGGADGPITCGRVVGPIKVCGKVVVEDWPAAPPPALWPPDGRIEGSRGI